MDKDSKAEIKEEKEIVKDKKKYTSPELSEYGSLEELTMTGGSSMSDFFGMRS